MVSAVVCGGRGERDGAFVAHHLDSLHRLARFSLIIEGGQRTRDPVTKEIVGGVDWHARQWAESRGVPCQTVKAEWTKHGKAAGPIRNQEMADMRPDRVVAFPGGSGTADMVQRAEAAGIPVIKVGFVVATVSNP